MRHPGVASKALGTSASPERVQPPAAALVEFTLSAVHLRRRFEPAIVADAASRAHRSVRSSAGFSYRTLVCHLARAATATLLAGSENAPGPDSTYSPTRPWPGSTRLSQAKDRKSTRL